MIRILDFTCEASLGWKGARTVAADYHQPVLVKEVVDLLQPAPGRVFLDGTLGGGGHSEQFLEAGARVIGLDQDRQALDFAAKRLAKYGEAFQPVQANFSEVTQVLKRLDIHQLDGALLDLGVSSWQLDTPERGFSFMRDGPLDMRMNLDARVTAADLVNNASVEQLERIFATFGEEPAARRIARGLVRDRETRPFNTTLQLAGAVEKITPRRGKTHPATRIFQALRIAVNRELEVLAEALEQLSERLQPGGRLGVITFHSLEDRIVKTFFKTRGTEWLDRPEWPEPRRNPEHIFRLITGKPVIATEEEQQQNPRARSAKLRVVERIDHGSKS
jgi:16S rRNA (cytosine1402-N4)-methyltransferase